jgi:hypothetical protein
VRVDFKRFGRGMQRRSDFAVEITWSDVLGLVRRFIEMRHPDAIHLARMIKLAEAVEDVGWSPDEASGDCSTALLERPI